MSDAFVYDCLRTPFGRFGGALASIRPDDLAAENLVGLLARSPSLDPALLDEVVLGNANGAGEENRNVARMALLLAGVPVSVPGSTVNRLCGSSLDAAMSVSRSIECGDFEIGVAGGVESMTRAPWVTPKTERAFPPGDLKGISTSLGWRLVNPEMPVEWTVSLGEANEQIQEQLGISRERQDAFAARSHRLAAAAYEAGRYENLVMRVTGSALERDEGIRPQTTPEVLSGLKPSIRRDGSGTITGGNASPLSDGAAMLLLGSQGASERIGRDPVARIVSRAAHGVVPQEFGLAPIQAAQRALDRAGLGWNHVGAVELNEAFAVQSLGCIDAWPIDHEIVNQWGGAIALGHPLGASGARLLGTLVAVLQVTGERYGVATLCIGVGQGLAVVLENVT